MSALVNAGERRVREGAHSVAPRQVDSEGVEMIIAAAQITLMIPENDSLKGKRRVVKSLVEKVRHKFAAAIAEVGDNDLWQKARIGVALVGNDSQLLSSRLQQIMQFMENQHLAEIIDSQVELCYLEK
jgi:uncharacterized protein YlxP (DUF503 family)